MHKIQLYCQSEKDAKFIKDYLEKELPYEILSAAQIPEMENSIRSRNIQMLILQTGKLVKQDITYARQLRAKGFTQPILMITDGVNSMSVEEISEKYRIFILEKPFELRALRGLVRKLLVSRAVPQQIFRRYRTNIAATLETFISGDSFHTHMFNLSRGGAYFELSEKPTVSVGDLLRMKVHLEDMDREHHVHGRIVWVTQKGHAAGGYGLGVKFIYGSDIYRSLLEKV